MDCHIVEGGQSNNDYMVILASDCQASIGCLSDMGASLLYIVLHARLWLSERVCLNIVGVIGGWRALKA